MGAFLDIIGSMIIGGMIMVMILSINANFVKTQGMQTLSKIVQTNATTASQLIEFDLRKIGYRCTDSLKVKSMSDTAFTFRGDFDDIGSVDSISYTYNSSTPVYTSSNNKRIRMLYRQYNNTTAQALNLGFSYLRFWYYDSLENTTTNIRNVKSVKIAMRIESPFRYGTTTQYDTGYYGMYWERIIKPKNLR